MSKNKIQFQKGLSLPEFSKNHGTEEQCLEALLKVRWPEFPTGQDDGQSISQLELARHLGVSSDTGAMVYHKLAQVMMERDSYKPLSGNVEIDDDIDSIQCRTGKLLDI